MMSFPEITGIVGAYQNCIRSVELYGPTNVAPIINRVAKSAEQAAGAASVSFNLFFSCICDGVYLRCWL